MKRGTPWKKLTRADLTNFDTTATGAVLTAMDQGAVGRVTARGHATIRGDNGQTMSVTRDTSAPHCKQNIHADLRRLFPEVRLNGTTKKNQDVNMHNDLDKPFSDTELPKATNGTLPAGDVLLQCPAKGCDKEFVTAGARHAHIRDDHATCTWEGADVEHDDPSYRCDVGPDGTAFVGASKQSVAGHVNIHHRGARPWESRDPAKRHAAAVKGAATRARKAGKKAAGAVSKPVANGTAQSRNTATTKSDSHTEEHRGLPMSEVKHRPTTPAAKLAAIRAILGDDPRVAQLEAQVAELKAQLDLVAEVLHLATPKKK